jgi:uncharacterized protein
MVTGASSGIGYHLARQAAAAGYDLILAADRPLREAAEDLRALGVVVEAVQVDLSTVQGVDLLCNVADSRSIDVLMANAGHGLGKSFLEQDFTDIRHVVNTNITGTIYLLQRVARVMVAQGAGKILVTGSIVGFQPGPFHAVYNGTKAFINSFTAALRNELKGTRVSVTCLMPGATDTDAFARAGLLDTVVGSTRMLQMNPAKVAETGFKAMLNGEADVVAGVINKAIVSMSKILPSQIVAELHHQLAKPGITKAGDR